MINKKEDIYDDKKKESQQLFELNKEIKQL